MLGFRIAFWLSWVQLTFTWCTNCDLTLIYRTDSAEASIFSCNTARGSPKVFFAKYLQNAGFHEIRREHDEVFAPRVTGGWDNEALELRESPPDRFPDECSYYWRTSVSAKAECLIPISAG